MIEKKYIKKIGVGPGSVSKWNGSETLVNMVKKVINSMVKKYLIFVYKVGTKTYGSLPYE